RSAGDPVGAGSRLGSLPARAVPAGHAELATRRQLPARHRVVGGPAAALRLRHLSKVHRATEWLKPSFARSSTTMSAAVRDQIPKPSCVSCQLGSPTTTRFTRTRLSDIVHPVS